MQAHTQKRKQRLTIPTRSDKDFHSFPHRLVVARYHGSSRYKTHDLLSFVKSRELTTCLLTVLVCRCGPKPGILLQKQPAFLQGKFPFSRRPELVKFSALLYKKELESVSSLLFLRTSSRANSSCKLATTTSLASFLATSSELARAGGRKANMALLLLATMNPK